MAIQEYDFDMEYIPGQYNVIADILSRIKKERQTTIIGDLTPAWGCAGAMLVLATTAPAIRRQGGFRTPTSGRQADMLTH